MTAIDPELSLDLTALRTAYADGRLTPSTLLEGLIERIESDEHPSVWIHRAPRAALLERARSLGAFDPSLPLWGVPFAVKDNIDVSGMPTTAACPDFAYQPERSALVVERLLAAGAICVGKTNLDQFATGLVGTRSPYGACRNVFNRSYLAGGSSSGSAVAVAAHQVSFALGTDTAGSGRVPAALANIVGVKPTRGLLANDGVVPACASLDCVSVFALTTRDGALVRDVMRATESLPVQPAYLGGLRVAIPDQLEYFGDYGASFRFTHAVNALRELGVEVGPVDWAPFAAIGNLLYGGPWVAERFLAVGDFIRKHPEAALPVTREIILGGESFSAVDTFRAQYRLAELRAQVNRVMSGADALLVPTTPTAATLADEAKQPRALNDRLGIYTRFANFLGWPALCVPAGLKPDGLPFGVTLLMREHEDRKLDHLGAALEQALRSGMGVRTRALAPGLSSTSDAAPRPIALPGYVRVAVVGAHLRGHALNHELLAARARFVRATRTAPSYRLYALAGTKPLKPGLVRTTRGGTAIAIELWDMPLTAFGSFVARIAPPLGIGTLECEDGELVQGFLCESHVVESAEDISSFGGFAAYVTQKG